MELIDGKKAAAEIKQEIAAKVAERIAQGKRAPHLAAILVGHDGGSETYVAHKIKACAECGFRSTLIRFESTDEAPLQQSELIAAVESLNNDPEVDGFIVQLPLPRHIDENAVIEAVDPSKDVDGFHPVNVGRASLLPFGHSRRYRRTVKAQQHTHKGQARGNSRPQQHRGQAAGSHADAERRHSRCHCHSMP